jgi:hypothetical protein
MNTEEYDLIESKFKEFTKKIKIWSYIYRHIYQTIIKQHTYTIIDDPSFSISSKCQNNI